MIKELSHNSVRIAYSRTISDQYDTTDIHQYDVLMHPRCTQRNDNCKECDSIRTKSSISFHIKLNPEVVEVTSREVRSSNWLHLIYRVENFRTWRRVYWYRNNSVAKELSSSFFKITLKKEAESLSEVWFICFYLDDLLSYWCLRFEIRILNALYLPTANGWQLQSEKQHFLSFCKIWIF
jgi:hypothetical protein